MVEVKREYAAVPLIFAILREHYDWHIRRSSRMSELIHRSERSEIVTHTEQKRVIHKSQLVNVSVTGTTVAVQGHSLRSPSSAETSPRSIGITLISPPSLSLRSPNGLSIEPIELGTPFTAEQLDEKRANRKVYDYLCRLLEVRNWLVECLQTADVPEEIQLEANLSNGVLLARLANFFAPDIAPVSKIFDFDQSRYKKEGKPCYRHTDNIMMWRRAVRAIRLPEVLIPETVDIYEGRNINTIFCLYALAIRLFRLRRGPPIRNQAGNAQFPDAVMEEMQERLKDSNIPAFSDLSGILDSTPSDKDSHTIAILELNKAIDSKEDLLKRLKNHDAGILYVNDRLIDNYQALLKDTKNLQQQGSILDREQIQKVVTKVNEIDALQRLDILFGKGGNFDLSEMTMILDDLQQEEVMQHAIPIYGDVLYRTRKSQRMPLSVQQVDDIVASVNACVRVKLSTLGNDAEELFEVLSNPELHCEDILNEQLKSIYLEELKNEYESKDKNFVLFADRIQAIVREVNSVTPQQRNVRSIRNAVEKNDEATLQIALQNIVDAKPEYVTYYLVTLRNVTYATMVEIEDVVRSVNIAVLRAEEKGRKAVYINRLLLEGKRNDVQKALLTSWKDIVIADNSIDYVARLEDELTMRKRSLGKDKIGGNIEGNNVVVDKEFSYLPEKFEAGVLYVNTTDNTIATQSPENINEWFLTSVDIENIIKKENDRVISEANRQREEENILAERKRREEAAIKIEQAWRRFRIRKDIDELKNSNAPSLRVVRTFIKTLVSTKEDAEEETEIEDNKSRVTKLINTNRNMDEQLQDLDKRIGLLVKNRINLQELIDHGNKLSKEAKDTDWLTAPSDAKQDRERWNPFEMIAYHMQTEPHHLTRLIANNYTKPEVLVDFFKRGMLPLFNFVADEREEFLLASLIRSILKRDIDGLMQPQALRKTPATTVTRILIPMVTDTKVMRPKIAELCKQLELKENQIDFFNLNVDAIYEAYEGHRPKNAKEAVENDQVAHVLNSSKTFLAKWSVMFASALFDKTIKLSRILRFLINSIYIDTKERFPRAAHADIMQGIAGWMYKSFWEQMVTAEIKGDGGSENDNINKRKAISQFIEFGVINIGYGEDKWYLSSLNEAITRINEFAMQLLTPVIAEEEEIYQQHKYSDLLGKRRPILHISLPQLNVLHRYLKANISEMLPDEKDPLRQLVEKTQPPNADQDVYVTLLLHPISIADSSQLQNDPQELFQRTKRYIIECLLCGCRGENVLILLENPTLEREEQKYKELPHSEENKMSLTAKKNQILMNLNGLEANGLVQMINHYQAIVTAIAKDINREREYRKERREQLQHLRKTITQMEEKRKEYIDRLNAYQEYLEKCLDNISITSKRPSIRPDSAKAGKIIKERQSLDVIQKVKCSAEKLDKQGILLSVDGYTTFKEYGKLTIEISTTDRPGIFMITISERKQSPQICEIDFQEILRAEHNEELSMKIGGRVNIHVQKFIAFLNKQFYSQ
uniref:Calponin-homology (CH) domain-containing protein n=1 Tax=Parascaris univalens TaxID=6257 RepID=A0A915AXX3_PARUN